MKSNLVFNCIVGAVILAIIIATRNPLALLGLYFLQQPQAEGLNLQDILSIQPEIEPEEDGEPSIGFMAEVR